MLDRYEISGKGLLPRMKYRELNEEIRDAFDRLSLYMISKETSDENS